MNGDQKKWVGRVLKFAVSGALLVAPLAGCGGSSEETVNEPIEEHTNEPMQPTGGGEDTGGEGEQMPPDEPPDGPNVNEPAPSE